MFSTVRLAQHPVFENWKVPQSFSLEALPWWGNAKPLHRHLACQRLHPPLTCFRILNPKEPDFCSMQAG